MTSSIWQSCCHERDTDIVLGSLTGSSANWKRSRTELLSHGNAQPLTYIICQEALGFSYCVSMIRSTADNSLDHTESGIEEGLISINFHRRLRDQNLMSSYVYSWLTLPRKLKGRVNSVEFRSVLRERPYRRSAELPSAWCLPKGERDVNLLMIFFSNLPLTPGGYYSLLENTLIS